MKVRMRFSKAGTMKFIGHLDVMRFFQKAFRRAGLDMLYSQGYNPHPLLSFASPLGVGLTSDGEYLDIQLASCGSLKEVAEKINRAMAVNENTPSEMRIESVRLLPDDSKAAMALVAAADYLVSLKDGYERMTDFEARFRDFWMQPSVVLKKQTKNGEVEMDLHPWIYEVAFTKEKFEEQTGRLVRQEAAQQYENGQKVYLRLSAGSVVNIKPEQVMEAFFSFLGHDYQPFAWHIHRLELYAAISSGIASDSMQENRFISLEELGANI